MIEKTITVLIIAATIIAITASPILSSQILERQQFVKTFSGWISLLVKEEKRLQYLEAMSMLHGGIIKLAILKLCSEVGTFVITDYSPNTIVKILETALASKGASLIKLVDKSDLTEYPDKLKMYLSVLENDGFITYHSGDRVYRTTYKGMQFSRTYNQTIHLLR